MSNLFKQASKAVGYLGGGLTLITFVQGIQQNKQNKIIIESLKKRIEMQEYILLPRFALPQNYESLIKNINDYSNLKSKASHINDFTESALRENVKITEITKSLETSNLDPKQVEILSKDFLHHSNNLSKDLSIGNKHLEELISVIDETFGSKFTNFPGSDILENFKIYLSTLPIEKVGALGHILVSIGILFSLFSIISIFYGDFLIKIYHLEEKFPRIARFIQIRRKFQLYYFTFNIIVIIFFMLFIIYVNFIVFLS